MDTHKWIKGIRLALGLLLAPAVAPFWLAVLLCYEMWMDPSWGENGAAFAMFSWLLLTCGARLAYLGALLIALPYALVMLGRKQLSFVSVMVATELLAPVYCLALNVTMSRHYVFVPNVVAWSVPAVVVSGFCFYLIGVWEPTSRHKNEPASVAAH